MKKLLLKGIIPALIAVALSSCLGSSSGTIEIQNDFAYITSSSEAGAYSDLFALTATGYLVTGPNVRALEKGGCYFVSAKLSTKNMASGNIFEADNAVASDRIPSTRVYPNIPNDPTIIQSKDAASSLTVGIRSVRNDFGDNWLFNYAASLAGDEKYDIYFYYDRENQVDKPTKEGEVGETIPPTAARKIIDIRFVKKGTAAEGAKPQSKSEILVANFSDVRYIFESSKNDPDVYKDEYGNPFVAIKFRFWKDTKDKEGNPTKELEYLGSWGEKGMGIKPTYSLAYDKGN